MVSIGGLVTRILVAPQRQPPSQGNFQSVIAASCFGRLGANMATLDPGRIYRSFRAAVNMEAAELEAWLDTAESRRVGFTRPGESESVGHAAGRHIARVLRPAEAAVAGGE